MRVLHLFDRYLNHTMNWAYTLLRHGLPKPLIAAPLLVQNEFLNPDFKFLPPLWPRPFATEWHIKAWQQALASLAWKRLPIYQQRLYQHLKKQPPDLLHAHFAPTGWYFAGLAKKLRRPLLVSFYGYDYAQLPTLRPVWKQRYRELFQQAAGFFVIGDYGAEQLQKMGCPPEKIRILPLGVETSDIPFRERKPHATAPLRILQAATITPKKGQMDSLIAFHRALRQAPNMQLTFTGEVVDADLYARLQNYVRHHQLEEQVQFLDFTPFGKFHHFLQAFDLFLQPSRHAPDGDCEGDAPIALLDAQATGMPVVSTRHCSIPSRVKHNQSGLLCPEGNTECLSQALLRFRQMNETEYASFSRNARRLIEEHFDSRQCGALLKKHYLELVTDGSFNSSVTSITGSNMPLK